MKTSLILLLIILTMAACSPQPELTPINIPSLIPVITATPVAIVVPITGTTPAATSVPVSPSIQVCTCPTSMVTPTRPPAGYVSPDYVICNCPDIPVPALVPTMGIGSNPQAIPANGITLGENGKTFSLHPGESFLLNLGMDSYNWTITIDNQNVLSRVRNIMVMRGAQGVYQANSPGKAVLSAEGDPLCRNSTPACMAPSIMFTVTIIVQ
ncbi:MAG: hypothetical protein ABSA01_16050 [Anaerolineales bacterium]